MAATFVNHVKLPVRQCGQKCHKNVDQIDQKIPILSSLAKFILKFVWVIIQHLLNATETGF